MIQHRKLFYFVLKLLCLNKIYFCYAMSDNVYTEIINRAKFGHRLTNFFITTLPGIDLSSCTKECSVTKACKSINYFRNFPICELHYGQESEGGRLLTNISQAVYIEESWFVNVSKSNFTLFFRHRVLVCRDICLLITLSFP